MHTVARRPWSCLCPISRSVRPLHCGAGLDDSRLAALACRRAGAANAGSPPRVPARRASRRLRPPAAARAPRRSPPRGRALRPRTCTTAAPAAEHVDTRRGWRRRGPGEAPRAADGDEQPRSCTRLADPHCVGNGLTRSTLVATTRAGSRGRRAGRVAGVTRLPPRPRPAIAPASDAAATVRRGEGQHPPRNPPLATRQTRRSWAQGPRSRGGMGQGARDITHSGGEGLLFLCGSRYSQDIQLFHRPYPCT